MDVLDGDLFELEVQVDVGEVPDALYAAVAQQSRRIVGIGLGKCKYATRRSITRRATSEIPVLESGS